MNIYIVIIFLDESILCIPIRFLVPTPSEILVMFLLTTISGLAPENGL